MGRSVKTTTAAFEETSCRLTFVGAEEDAARSLTKVTQGGRNSRNICSLVAEPGCTTSIPHFAVMRAHVKAVLSNFLVFCLLADFATCPQTANSVVYGCQLFQGEPIFLKAGFLYAVVFLCAIWRFLIATGEIIGLTWG